LICLIYQSNWLFLLGINFRLNIMPSGTSTLSEKELLRKVAGGDDRSFRFVFDKYRNKIYSLSMYVTHSEYISEEITQEVFCKIWNNRADLEKIDFFNSYLRTIAVNTACNYLKRLANEKVILKRITDESEVSSDSTENTVLYNDYQAILEQAIMKLSPQQRKVYLLSRHKGLKQEEIAKRMNLSVYTVKEHMKNALRSIRKSLGEKIELTILAAAQIFLN